MSLVSSPSSTPHRLAALAPFLLALLAAGCDHTKTGDTGGDTSSSANKFDLDGDGYASPADCDDSDATISPGAAEICDGIDNDCDSQVDEYGVADGTTWYPDADGDGYGDPNTPIRACSQPEGTVADNTDCDDANAASAPGQIESCDGLDDDCDGLVDEEGASGGIQMHVDTDGDGYGDASSSAVLCTVTDGYVADDSDCDDANPEVQPLADEICDGIDNNCDGATDDASAIGAKTWYKDGDADGYGLDAVVTTACDKPTGYASRSGDCDDAISTINPGEHERCNGFDDNCDDVIDTDAVDLHTWYYDGDDDGYGVDTDSITQCDAPSSQYVTVTGDCDDGNAEISPGQEEACFDSDGIDNNCDGYTDPACDYGKLNYQEGWSRTKGARDCDLWWDTVWQPTASICDACDYSFDVTFTEDTADSTGSCYTRISDTATWKLGVDFDYDGTGEPMVWYSYTYTYYYYGGYYYAAGSPPPLDGTRAWPMFDATYDESTGMLTFSDGTYDYPYSYGRRTYYETNWTYGYVDLNGD